MNQMTDNKCLQCRHVATWWDDVHPPGYRCTKRLDPERDMKPIRVDPDMKSCEYFESRDSHCCGMMFPAKPMDDQQLEEFKKGLEDAAEKLLRQTGVVQPIQPGARSVEDFIEFLKALPPISEMSDSEFEIAMMKAKRFHDALNDPVNHDTMLTQNVVE